MTRVLKEATKIKEGFLGQKMIVVSFETQQLLKTNSVCENLYITAIGFYPNANFHYRKRKNGAAQYILVYCIAGQGQIIYKGEPYILKPNSYFILPKHEEHQYYSSKDNPWSIYWIHFNGKLASYLYSRFLECIQKDKNIIPFTETRTQQFELIYSILENSHQISSMELISLQLCSYLSSFIYNERINRENTTIDQVSKGIEFMKTNIQYNYSIEELAKELNLSISHFSGLFKKKTGYSPIQYFNQLKINQSCQYLTFTNLSIKEICNKIGFKDPYYFSRLFKKNIGICPQSYRNEYKKLVLGS